LNISAPAWLKYLNADIAEDASGQVVGVALAGPNWEPSPAAYAEIRILYVRDAHQRRGIGRALVQAAAERLAAWGHSGLLIWVFEPHERARRFYEALDGQLRGERTREIRGFTVHEVAYGWDDLQFLASLPTPLA
jgi:GNAT superfamily N-acetyltransferase